MENQSSLVVVACLLLLATASAQINNFGNTLEDCVTPITKEDDFCVNDITRTGANTPDSVLRYRTITGICNNIGTGKATVGAGETVLPRFRRAVYFDRGVFPSLRSDIGFDTPLGHPSLPDPVGVDAITPQDVSDIVFNVSRRNIGNSGRAPHLMMTFGQFLDHDFALSLHAESSACSSSCDRRRNPDFNYPCFPVTQPDSRRRLRRCVPFIRSFAACQADTAIREQRQQVNNLTHYIDGSNIYGSTDFIAKQLRNETVPYLLKTQSSSVGELLPFLNVTDEPCLQNGGCFLAGESRVNENTALATMHTIWVRLHNFYARKINALGEVFQNVQQLKSIVPNAPNRNTIIFEEARKIVVAIYQHIIYNEFLPRLAAIPSYGGYKPSVNAQVSNEFTTAVFRFGHTLIRNNFPRLRPNFRRAARPLSLREAFNNNNEIFQFGIERIVYGLIGGEAEEFDNVFSSGVVERLFIPPRERGFQNLMAFNIQRGRDHGLDSYLQYRKFCAVPNDTQVGSNPFSIFSNTITNPAIIDALVEAYKSPSNHIDFFAAGISETNDGQKLLGRTFGCIMSRTFQALRDGDRFYYENKEIFSVAQQNEVRKMNMARVMCLTLRDAEDMHDNLFEVFNSQTDVRRSCTELLAEGALDVKDWLLESIIPI